MTHYSQNVAIMLSGLICLMMLGCSDPDEKWTVAKNRIESVDWDDAGDQFETRLKDGVYPAIWKDGAAPDDAGGTIVELKNIPVQGEESPPEMISVIDQPLLHFGNVEKFDFKFEKNECTQIGFQNSEKLKSYSRDHIGSRLAVVIDNQVISVHKIREAIESDQVQITCCTVGGGDHLHQHLTQLKQASTLNADSNSMDEELTQDVDDGN